MGLAAAALEGRRTGSYERHRPETTTLYAVVRDNVETLYAAVAAGFEGAALPPFVRRELEGYLDCGLLCRGFARLKCESCSEQHLVAFACKGRGICPSCLGRKMCQTALNLTEHVLPPVPLRQWVFTLPHPLRARLAYDAPLLGAVTVRGRFDILRRSRIDVARISGNSRAVIVIRDQSRRKPWG